MRATQDTVVNIGFLAFVRLALLIHAACGLGIGPVGQKQVSASPAYVVSDVANHFANLLKQRPEAEKSLLLKAEVARSHATIQQAASEEDKALLEEVYEIQEESRMEQENAKGVAASLSATLQQFMGEKHGARSCRGLSCGGNAYCSAEKEGATCKCKAGYEGTGFVCNPARALTQRPLISAAPSAAAPQVADLHVASLRNNGVAVAFRDNSRQNRGFVVLGVAGDGGMRWSAPALLSSSSQVFGPVLVELEAPNTFAAAYRTSDRGGDGVLLCGRRDAENRLQLGAPQVFAHYQAQAMALIALPQSRVVVLFSDHVPVKGASGQFDHFGTSLLAQLPAGDLTREGPIGLPQLLGKYHFAKGAVSRITVAPISPKTFAIAFRQGRGQDVEGVSPSREASVSLAELWGSELVFTTQPLSLEPERDQIWARSVAGLGGGALAYTYHSGAEQVTKQAVLRLDPTTHRLAPIREPKVLASGFTPFVSTISTIRQEASPDLQGTRLFAFFGGENGAKGQVQLCAVDAQGLPDRCQDAGATNQEVLGVAATLLTDNRVFLLTSTARGEPFYSLIGL